ncbi:membrane protein implicated in regulation of membrane protease activity [Bradyrhizobium sp. GM2.4]
MTDMFVSLGTWNWLIFGFILMALEVLAPGVFLFWLGLAALLVGLISFGVAISWQIQLVMFAIFAAAAVPVWRRLARPKPDAIAASPFLNKRADALLGREFTLEKPIVDGNGTMRIRRHRLARRRSRYAGGHACEGGASGRRESDGGGGLVHRHCERSEAIQTAAGGKILDCFASLAMTS